MTVLTMRLIKGDFIVTGPDIEPMKFKSRSEARDLQGAPSGSPITEIGPGGKRWQPRNRQSDRAGEARSARRDRIWARKSAQSEIAPAARAESLRPFVHRAGSFLANSDTTERSHLRSPMASAVQVRSCNSRCPVLSARLCSAHREPRGTRNYHRLSSVHHSVLPPCIIRPAKPPPL
jgi:hypothetical protein